MSQKTQTPQIALIMFDLNGVLCTKHPPFAKISGRYVKTQSYILAERPYMTDYVISLMSVCDVAIFSSTTSRNAYEYIDKIFGDHADKFKFIWFRDRCKLDPAFGRDPRCEYYSTIKLISDVLECPSVNEHRLYNIDNVVIVDDSEDKLRFNPPHTRIIIEENDGPDEIEAKFNDRQLVKLYADKKYMYQLRAIPKSCNNSLRSSLNDERSLNDKQ